MTTTVEPRLLTPKEVALLVRTLRETRQWTQDTLAEIAKVTPRTVQRVEAGEPSDLHTRRALAGALGCEDPDFFNRRLAIPTEDEARALQEEFEREHVVLDVTRVASGRELAALFEVSTMDVSLAGKDASDEVAREFASMVDELRDYRDIASDYSETEKCAFGEHLLSRIVLIAASGFVVCAARRQVRIGNDQMPTKTPWDANLLYLTTMAKESSQTKIAVPRRIAF